MARFTSKLTLVLGLCAALALANAANHAQVDNRPKVICNDHGKCYPRLFKPTTEFQEVLEGQEIPPGLHVQMDFNTHKKFAKLMDNTEQVHEEEQGSVYEIDTTKSGLVQQTINNAGHDLMPIDVVSGEQVDQDQLAEASRLNMQAAFDSLSDDQTSFDTPSSSSSSPSEQQQYQQGSSSGYTKPNAKLTMADHSSFTDQFAIVLANENVDKVSEALSELADIVREMDFGIKLVEHSGFKKLMEGLVPCHRGQDCQLQELVDLRANAALVLGAAVQNHPAAQKVAFHLSLDRSVLNWLQLEQNPQVLRRLITAYSNLVRGQPERISSKDIETLAKVYKRLPLTDLNSRRKFEALMFDFADPDMRGIESGGIDESMVDVGPWCGVLQNSLALQEAAERENMEGDEQEGEWDMIDELESTVRAVDQLNRSFPSTCVVDPSTAVRVARLLSFEVDDEVAENDEEVFYDAEEEFAPHTEL